MLNAASFAAALALLLVLAAPVAHAQYTNNYQTNTYDGVSASTNWGGEYVVGSNTVFDVLQVLNGAGLTNTRGYLGYTGSTASNNLVVVSGSGSLWTNTAFLAMGGSGNNRLIITNGGTVANNAAYISYNWGADNNTVLVSGNGSLWNNKSILYVGQNGSGNQLIITNGGTVVNSGGYVGYSSGANNNSVLVSGSGSLWTNNGDLSVGGVGGLSFGSGNQVIVTNGGHMFVSSVVVGGSAGANGNTVWIESGGLLDASSLIVTNSGNSITNFGGVFQFSSAAPTITTNNGGVGGLIVLTNGTIAFRNLDTANVKGNWSGSQLTNITFQGANTFRLNSASNTTSGQDYTFNTGLGATNYVGLEMINGATAWRGGSLTIGNGGTMLVSNTAANVAGVITNAGTMTVLNSRAIYNGNVVNLGAYVSDPSTNTFNGNFTVGPTGVVNAASNDVYAFGGDFILQSTNRAFNMVQANVVFATNGYGLATTTRLHTLDLTNSGAVDKGSNWINHLQLQTNFAIGTLTIGLSNQLTVTGMKSGGTTNALYVGILDLSAWNTNAGSLNSTLQEALHLPDINVYYDKYAAGNAYLQGLEFNVWSGGGLLIPIPEPSAAGLILGGALFSAWLLRRKRNHSHPTGFKRLLKKVLD